jgi:hypothetical protein
MSFFLHAHYDAVPWRCSSLKVLVFLLDLPDSVNIGYAIVLIISSRNFVCYHGSAKLSLTDLCYWTRGIICTGMYLAATRILKVSTLQCLTQGLDDVASYYDLNLQF